jgi:hypothetical protein
MRAETGGVGGGGSNRTGPGQLARGTVPTQGPHPDLLPNGRKGRAEPVVLFASLVMPAHAGIQS